VGLVHGYSDRTLARLAKVNSDRFPCTMIELCVQTTETVDAIFRIGLVCFLRTNALWLSVNVAVPVLLPYLMLVLIAVIKRHIVPATLEQRSCADY
jgi:hypothetical protein